MLIKETKDPKTLKKYVRYVVEKYHELAKKYIDLKDVILAVSSDNECLRLENIELKKDNKSYNTEIKNLYSMLSDKKFIDSLSENVLEYNQLNLFHDIDEDLLPIIEFNELVDNDHTEKITNKKEKQETYGNRF